MRTAQVLPYLALLFALASCSGVQARQDSSQPPPPKTTVEVRNLKLVDFNVFVLSGALRLRLGTVPASNSRTFTIPPHLVRDQGTLRFQADPIGSDEVASTEDELLVRPGDELNLTLQ